MNRRLNKMVIVLAVALVLSSLLGACAVKKSVVEPVVKPPSSSREKVHPPDDLSAPSSPASPGMDLARDALVRESMECDRPGKGRIALEAYGRALKLARGDERKTIRNAIRGILAEVDTQLIEEFLGRPDAGIPQDLLLYRLGLNRAVEGDYDRAVNALTLFTGQYPHDPDAGNARELIDLMVHERFQNEVIGCLLPLSGRFAMFGRRALKGVAMAVSELSRSMDRDIRIIIKDTRSDDGTAVQGVRELESKKAAAIVGPIITAESAGREAQSLGIPLIAMTQKEDAARGGDYIFSNFFTPEMQSRALVTYAASRLGIKRFAILYPDDRYGRRYMNLFWDMVEETGGEIIGVEAYGSDQTDFADEIRQIADFCYPLPLDFQESSGDFSGSVKRFSAPGYSPGGDVGKNALFIPDAPSKVSLIVPQLIYNDVSDLCLLGTNLWHDDTLLKNAADYVKNAVIIEGFFSGTTRKDAADFVKRFQLLYQETPGFIEAAAYDTVTLLVRTAMESGVNSRESLRDALGSSRVHEGVTGRFMFDEEGNAHRELFYLTVKGRRFVEISH